MSFGNFGQGRGYGQPGGIAAPATAAVQGSFLTQAFFWMFAGLLLSAAVATVVQFNESLVEFAASNFLILIIAQLGLVLAIGFGINRINATLALGLFFVYAASLGLTIGLIVLAYTQTSVAAAFLSASAMFGGAALYGAVTKRNLAGIGSIAFMALIGLIVASVVNIFLGSDTIGWIISLAGVAIFTALTAWDVQRIQSGQLVAMTGSVEKAAVIGALHLYLDFVNLFLFLLRLFGDRR
ncbi:MAG TPA: Bax inhibitor-1/YccA family protein [Candidatus Deferrimicrobiaceae bacterium]|nr:Bax inhibitor-1/YccA family protein [Candidatus Deferrimicrobiaceae bacterium]